MLLLNIPPDTRGLFHEKDVERLAELKQYLDNAFTENLASAAKLSASAEKSGFPVTNVLEDNGYWTTEDWTDTAEIMLDFPAEVKFNSVILQEQITVGQRISSFAVDYFNGSEWVECAAGKTVGHKKILEFDEVATNPGQTSDHRFTGLPDIKNSLASICCRKLLTTRAAIM